MTTVQNKSQASPCTMWSDGVCVYLFIKVNNPLLPKIALLIADIFIFSVFIFGIIVDIPGLCICSLLFLALLTWYSLWNFFGEERLIINTISLNYSHHYSFIKTAFSTKQFNKRLMVQPVDEISDGTEQQMQISFSSYSDMNMPIELYRTSFYISKTNYVRLIDLINGLMVNDVTDKYQLPEINPN